MKNTAEFDLPLKTTTPGTSQADPGEAPLLHLLGIPFHGLTREQALDRVNYFIAEGQATRQICLSNAHTVSVCWEDSELLRILEKADLVLADGMSIVWGGRWIGVDLPCRIAGPDFTEALCADAEMKGHRVFFLGSTPETLAKLQDILLLKWPRLQIAGLYSPPMCDKLSAEDNKLILEEIHAAKPDILFVGMSMPKQEKWIAENLKTLKVPVAIGIGAAFDFISGRIPRAPLFFQTTGMEWLYRLYREPRRLWKRYLLGNYIFLSLLTREAVKIRLAALKKTDSSQG